MLPTKAIIHQPARMAPLAHPFSFNTTTSSHSFDIAAAVGGAIMSTVSKVLNPFDKSKATTHQDNQNKNAQGKVFGVHCWDEKKCLTF